MVLIENKSYPQVGNLTDVNPFHFIGLLGTVLYSVSYLTDILAMVTIFKSRGQLKLAEVFILNASQALSLSYKLFSVFIVLALYFDKFVLGNLTCVRFYPFTFGISICYNFMWLYYSLYQYSSIQRTGHYLKLFNFTHNLRNFGLVASGAFASTFALVLCMFNVFRADMLNETNDGKCGILYKSPHTLALIIYTSSISFMVLFVYVISIVNLINKVRSKNSLSSSDMSRYRKSFRISVKFLCFSFFPFSSCCIRIGFVLLAHFCPTCKKYYYDLLQFLIIFSYIIEPTLIIYVHNILKKECLNLMRKIVDYSTILKVDFKK